MTIEKILHGCKNNDRECQRLFYEQFKTYVMGIARRYSSTTEEARDIFQESFIEIFTNLHNLREYKVIAAWVRKVSIHTAIRHYNKTLKNETSLDQEYISQMGSNDYTLIIEGIGNDQLIGLINDLPAGYRIVFNLYVIEGYRHAEISRMLTISENTSKSQLSRAKGLLKQKLKVLGIHKYEGI